MFGYAFPPVVGRYRHVRFADERPGGPVDLAPGRAGSSSAGYDGDDATLTPDDAELVQDVFGSAGLDPSDYRADPLRRRLPACLRALRVETPVAARTVLHRDVRLAGAALGALVLGVTSFFRDTPVFDALAACVLPALLARPGRFRAWSVGCSDGAELLSLAMLIDEAGGLDRADLLGTDCRADACRRAAAGTYAPGMMRGLTADRVARHFEPAGDGGYRVRDALRAAVRWRSGNALTIEEPGAWDLILCRNVMMYFRPHAVRLLCERFRRQLAPGGHLVLGRAERPSPAEHWTMVTPCVYQPLPGVA